MEREIKILKRIVIFLVVLLVIVFCFKAKAFVKKIEFVQSMHKAPSTVKYETKDLAIKGVKGTYKFLYIADTHIFIKTRDNLGVIGTAEDRNAIFHNDKNVSSRDQFPNWIRLANQQKVTALLMGGDIIDYASKENYNYIDKYLAGLDMPYLYTMGNHDAVITWENNRYIYKNKQLLKRFINKDFECQYFEYPSFIICSVNNSEGGISKKALREFKKVYKKNKPIILSIHIPLNTDKTATLERDTVQTWKQVILLGTDSTYGNNNLTKEFLDLVLAKNSPVVEVLAGHIHFYHEDALNDKINQIVSDGSYKGNGIIFNVHGK